MKRPHRLQGPTLALVLLLIQSAAPAATKTPPPKLILHVAASSTGRTESVASAELPAIARGAAWLKGPDGKRIPLQVDPQGRGWFIVANLPAGSARDYEVDLNRRASSREPACTVEYIGSALSFQLHRLPVVQYHQALSDLPRPDIRPIYQRGGYMHPVLTPSGFQVTDDYPTNHAHHHGIWSAWTQTTFEGRHPDFWNMGDNKGSVTPLLLEGSWEGTVHAGFRSRHRYQDLTTTPRRIALDETWETRIYALGGKKPSVFIFDLEIQQTCHGPAALELLEYRYGGLGVRGNEQWNGASHAQFLTSEGISDRVKAHATKARWCAMWGTADGKQGGLAILCHPENFRAPQPMRIHPDEPFFCYAPPLEGDFQITPQEPYRARYRFVSFDGPPQAALLQAAWEDYAHPLVVEAKSP